VIGKLVDGLRRFLSRLFPGLERGPAKPPPEIQAGITLPKDGSGVPYRTACEGTHSGIPEGMELWLVTFWEEIGVYYPQGNSLIRLPDGKWHSVVSVGQNEKESLGQTYDLLLVATTRGGTRRFVKYGQESSARGRWSGMFNLPRGTVVLDTVTLTRR